AVDHAREWAGYGGVLVAVVSCRRALPGGPGLTWRSLCRLSGRRMERVTGIEPALSAWEADVLPLNYTRAAAHVRTAAGPAYRTQPGGFTSRPLGASAGFPAGVLGGSAARRPGQPHHHPARGSRERASLGYRGFVLLSDRDIR